MKRLFAPIVLLAATAIAPFAAIAQFSVVEPSSLALALGAGKSATETVSIRIDPFCVRPILIAVDASAPDAVVENLSGNILNNCGGDVSAFDVRFTGVGADQSFDLQFVDAEAFNVIDSIPVTIASSAARVESLGEAGTLLSCFYDCGPRPTGGWRELTTLLLANPGGDTVAGRVVVLDGNASAIGVGAYDLGPDDLDEINVCATLDAAGIDPPLSGLVHVTVAAGSGAYAWVKDWTGRFSRDNPEPSAGAVSGVGKTECRVVAPGVGTAEEALARAATQNPPPLAPVLVGGTDDQ